MRKLAAILTACLLAVSARAQTNEFFLNEIIDSGTFSPNAILTINYRTIATNPLNNFDGFYTGDAAGLTNLIEFDPIWNSASNNVMLYESETNEINALADKVVVVGADVLLIEDSAASFAKKRLSFSNLSEQVAEALEGFASFGDIGGKALSFTTGAVSDWQDVSGLTVGLSQGTAVSNASITVSNAGIYSVSMYVLLTADSEDWEVSVHTNDLDMNLKFNTPFKGAGVDTATYGDISKIITMAPRAFVSLEALTTVKVRHRTTSGADKDIRYTIVDLLVEKVSD